VGCVRRRSGAQTVGPRPKIGMTKVVPRGLKGTNTCSRLEQVSLRAKCGVPRYYREHDDKEGRGYQTTPVRASTRSGLFANSRMVAADDPRASGRARRSSVSSRLSFRKARLSRTRRSSTTFRPMTPWNERCIARLNHTLFGANSGKDNDLSVAHRRPSSHAVRLDPLSLQNWTAPRHSADFPRCPHAGQVRAGSPESSHNDP
jgi:hypothetical protein